MPMRIAPLTGNAPSPLVIQPRAQLASGFQQPFVSRTCMLRQIGIADKRAERFDQAIQDALRGAGCNAARRYLLIHVTERCVEVFQIGPVARGWLRRYVLRHDETSLL